jgi:hypothetical protein
MRGLKCCSSSAAGCSRQGNVIVPPLFIASRAQIELPPPWRLLPWSLCPLAGRAMIPQHPWRRPAVPHACVRRPGHPPHVWLAQERAARRGGEPVDTGARREEEDTPILAPGQVRG